MIDETPRPAESVDPHDVDQGRGPLGHAPCEPPANRPISEGDPREALPASQPTRHTTVSGKPRHRARRAPRTPPTWTPRQRVAMALDARHERADAICAACPTESGRALPRSTLAAWRALPGWADGIRAIQSAMKTDVDARKLALSLDALEVLGQAVRGEIEVDANERCQAAGRVLAASQAPGEATRRAAAKEARQAWLAAIAPEAPDVRARVLGRLEGSLDALSTEELERLAGGDA